MNVSQMESWLARSRATRKDYSLVPDAERLLREGEEIFEKLIADEAERDAELKLESECLTPYGTHQSPIIPENPDWNTSSFGEAR